MPKGTPIDWSGVDLRQSIRHLMHQTGCSRSAAIVARKKYGISRAHPGAVEADWSKIDWRRTNSEIASQLGCATSTVSVHRPGTIITTVRLRSVESIICLQALCGIARLDYATINDKLDQGRELTSEEAAKLEMALRPLRFSPHEP